MTSRPLLLSLIAVLALLPASGLLAEVQAPARGDAAALPETVQTALQELDADWSRLRESLPTEIGGRSLLSERLSPALGEALLRLQPALARCELSPHRTGAGLHAIVRDAARSAGAGPAEVAALEALLRTHLPRWLELSLPPTLPAVEGPRAGDLSPAELVSLLGPTRTRERATMRLRYCALRPTACEGLDSDRIDGQLLRLIRESRGGGLPESVALDLRAALAPSAPESLR